MYNQVTYCTSKPTMAICTLCYLSYNESSKSIRTTISSVLSQQYFDTCVVLTCQSCYDLLIYAPYTNDIIIWIALHWWSMTWWIALSREQYFDTCVVLAHKHLRIYFDPCTAKLHLSIAMTVILNLCEPWTEKYMCPTTRVLSPYVGQYRQY